MSNTDKSKKFADVEEQFRQFQNEIAISKSKQVDIELAHSADTARGRGEPVPQSLSERHLEPIAQAGADNAKIKKLEEAFHRTKSSKSIEQFGDTPRSGNGARLVDMNAGFQDSTLAVDNKAFRAVIEDEFRILNRWSHSYRAPRDITMAILAGMRSKHMEQSGGWDAGGKKNSEVQMAHDFLDVLDEITVECCGAHFEAVFPELVGADNFFEIARKLNAIRDRGQHRQSGHESFDILLSGAIIASSSRWGFA